MNNLSGPNKYYYSVLQNVTTSIFFRKNYLLQYYTLTTYNYILKSTLSAVIYY